MELTWGLIICTYNRADFLFESIRYALNQSRMPTEIAIVDASDYWQETRDRLLELYPDHWNSVKLTYQPAKVRSIPFQRNQALELTTSNVIFSLDDDIYLEKDAAENIMLAYDSDKENEIAIIGGQFTDSAPDVENHPAELESRNDLATHSFLSSLKSRLENALTLQNHFVPYGPPVRDDEPPSSINSVKLLKSGLMNGGRTTFRRDYGIQCKWSELLRYYATHEDSDFSYRMSFYGKVLVARDAGFFHADGAEDRPNRFRTNTIRVRNLMALHRVESSHRVRSAWRLTVSFLRFAGLYMLIDPARGRFSLPIVRAYLWGIALIPYFMFYPFQDFTSWYTKQQEKMYNNH